MAKDVAREATPAAVKGGIDGLAKPENQAVIGELISRPEFKSASARVAAGIVEGSLASLGSTTSQAAMARMTRSEIAAIVGASRGALVSALAGASGTQASDFVALTSRSAVRGLADGVRSDLGPALRDVLRRELQPALTGMFDQAFNEALGRTAREVARQSALGMQDALLAAAPGKPGKAPPEGIRGLLSSSVRLAQLGAVVLGLLGVGLGIWLAWSLVQLRRIRLETVRRESAVLLLAEAIRSTKDRPWAKEFHDALAPALENPEAGPILSGWMTPREAAAAETRRRPRSGGRRGPSIATPR